MEKRIAISNASAQRLYSGDQSWHRSGRPRLDILDVSIKKICHITLSGIFSNMACCHCSCSMLRHLALSITLSDPGRKEIPMTLWLSTRSDVHIIRRGRRSPLWKRNVRILDVQHQSRFHTKFPNIGDAKSPQKFDQSDVGEIHFSAICA